MPRYRNIDEHHRALTNARTLTSVVERIERCQALTSVIERHQACRTLSNIVETHLQRQSAHEIKHIA